MDFLFNNFKTVILGITVIVLVILVIKYYKRIKTFLLEVKQELSKVAWSNRQELIASTFVIITITAIMAFFIFIIDFSLSRALSFLFR